MQAGSRHGSVTRMKAEVRRNAARGRAFASPCLRTTAPPPPFLILQLARNDAKFEADFKTFLATEAAAESAHE